MNENIKLDNDSADDDGTTFTFNPDNWNNTWPFKENDTSAGLMLDWESADRITICNLKYHLECIYDKEHNHKVFGEFYHEEDKEQDRKLKKALKRVLKYFGEEVE